MDFHKLFEKAYAKTASAFSQLRTGPTAINYLTNGNWSSNTQTLETSLTQNRGHRPNGL
jgi:hypothetical protein